MVAAVKDSRDSIIEDFERISGILYREYPNYLPYHQGGTISASGSVSAFGWTEAESDYVWIPPQDADRQKAFMFLNFVGALNQAVENVTEIQTTFELMDAWSSGTYYSSTLAAYRGQLLREAIVSSLQNTFIGVESIGWNLPGSPEPIKKAIDLALKKGYHAMAVKLASKGLQLFPEDTDLKKIAEILAPPKVIQTNIPPSEGLKESMNWLKENRSKYQGQWVALRDGMLLGHAESREQLVGIVDNTSKAIIAKVP